MLKFPQGRSRSEATPGNAQGEDDARKREQRGNSGAIARRPESITTPRARVQFPSLSCSPFGPVALIFCPRAGVDAVAPPFEREPVAARSFDRIPQQAPQPVRRTLRSSARTAADSGSERSPSPVLRATRWARCCATKSGRWIENITAEHVNWDDILILG